MSRVIFDYLFSKNVTKDNSKTYFNNLSRDELYDFVSGLNKYIPETLIAKHGEDTSFHFLANEGFSGTAGCTNIECGFDRVIKLNRIAALYADVTYIFNPFKKLEYQLEDNVFTTNFLRERLVKNIFNMFVFENVIHAGRLKLITKEEYRYCTQCFPEHDQYKNTLRKRFKETISPELYDIYKSNCIFYVDSTSSKSYRLTIDSTNTELMEHSSMSVRINDRPSKSIKKAYSRKSRKLWKNELSKELVELAYEDYLEELYDQSLFSNLTFSNFLSDRFTDLNLLHKLSESTLESSHQKQPEKFIDGVQHALPLLTELNIKDVVELREKEGEAFINYRDAFSKLLLKSDTLKPYEIKEAFTDIIQPELNNIEITVRNFRESKRKSIVTNVFSLSAFLYIGLFSGILPTSIGNAVAALSSFNNISNLIKDSTSSHNSELRKNRFYFIWKMIRK